MYIYTLGLNKSSNWSLHCVSRIHFKFQIVTICLVFLKNKNTYKKEIIKLSGKQQDMFNVKFKQMA